MKESEWIDPREQLPKINQLVEVSFSVRGKLFEVERVKFSINKNGFIGFIGSTELMCNIDSILGWRPIPEKQPDFSRLNIGDLVFIELESNSFSKVGFIRDIDKKLITVARYRENDYSDSICNLLSEIKKITRINIDDKTFEEI